MLWEGEGRGFGWEGGSTVEEETPRGQILKQEKKLIGNALCSF